jgi:integrase
LPFNLPNPIIYRAKRTCREKSLISPRRRGEKMGRKGHSEGIPVATLEKRGNGYRLTFWYDGKRYQGSLKTEIKKDADQLKARVERNLQLFAEGRIEYQPGDDLFVLMLSDGKVNSRPQVTERIDLGEFFARYNAERPPGKEANTRNTESIHIAHLLRLLGNKTNLSDVPERLQAYVTARSAEVSRSGSPISQVTIKKELSTLTSIWNRWGIRATVVNRTLTLRNLEYPKGKQKPPFQTWEQIERRIVRGQLNEDEQAELWDALFLTVSQIEELLSFVRTNGSKIRETVRVFPWVYPMFAFIAYTGARRSEMIRSRIEDIDFETGEITIREKKKDRTIKETMRRVPMAENLRNAMSAWLAIHPGGPLTFCKTRDEPLTEAMATHYLRWTLDGGKWKVVRGFHCLRHSFISNLASRGVSERIIMALAGHLNRETSRRYAHLIPSTVHDAMRLVFNASANAIA